jgi:two-component system sensor histidine kinase HydH
MGHPQPLVRQPNEVGMAAGFGTRVQVALVIVLFLGSLSVLLFNTFSVLGLSRREDEVRGKLRDAARRMVERSRPISEELDKTGESTADTDRQLREIAAQALADMPGVEGGFYLGFEDRFTAYAFPTGDHGPKRHARTDPPPLEAPYIRVQSRQSVELPPGEFLVTVRNVGPSRVAFLTEPVGTGRPATLVVWVMVRLSGPKQMETKVTRYATSTGLALGSVVVALLLSWNLSRTLERQRAYQERLRDELRRSEHLAALGRLLAGVAHEVRNPLAAIRSTVQLWQRLPDQARTPESMLAVVSAVDRLDDLVARLLHFSRADGIDRKAVDLNQLIVESLALVEAQATAQNVLLDPQLTPGLAPVAGSANALRQVVLNLLTNALQAMPSGGRLRCSTRWVPASRMIELRVEDTGHGVAEADRPRLFEPFFTTRPEGTGLGLALCREIILGHGGRIELESSGPDGSVFLVVLPAFA